MKTFLMNIVKHYPGIRIVYNTCGNLLIRFIGLFVSTDPKLILMNSFGGKKYDDSPKEIFEMMKKDPRFRDYKIVWAFHDPSKFNIEGAEVIKTDNLHYFITALKAKCWITNSGVGRGLSFKKKNTVYINTWHGTPLKLMGQDSPEGKKDVKYGFDLQCAQSEFEARTFSHAFCVPYENYLLSGYPRNDPLAKANEETKREMRRKIGISVDKIVLLYAPTFREYERDASLNCVLKPPVSFKKWREQLGNEYQILMRCHYEVTKLFSDEIDGEFVIDVSDYPTLNELMIASDALITDYSSIMFDYSILDRPIYIFAYDYDEYKAKRGMYFDIRKELPGGDVSEDELLNIIKTVPENDALQQVRTFRSKYVTAYGHATADVLEATCKLLQER